MTIELGARIGKLYEEFVKTRDVALESMNEDVIA